MFSPRLFGGTLRIWRTALVWWPLGLFLYVFLDAVLVAIIARSLNVAEVFASMPSVMLQVFVGPGATPDLARGVRGGTLFYTSGIFLGIGPIFAALFAMFTAPGLIAGEWERGTLDTLLARPLTRRAYVATRFAAFAVLATLVAVVVFFAHVLALGPVAGLDVPARGLAEAVAGWWLMALAFGAVAFFVGALRLSRAAGTAAALALLLLMETLNIAALGRDELKELAKLSFAYHWRPIDMLFEETAGLAVFALPAGVALVALVAATLVFERRDLS